MNGACIEDVRLTARADSPTAAAADTESLAVLASHEMSSGCSIASALERNPPAAEGRPAFDADAIDELVSVVPLYVHEGVLVRVHSVLCVYEFVLSLGRKQATSPIPTCAGQSEAVTEANLHILLDYHAAGLLDAHVRFRVEQAPARGRLLLAGRPLVLPPAAHSATGPASGAGADAGARTREQSQERSQERSRAQQSTQELQRQARPSFSVVDLKRRALRYEHDASESASDALMLALEFGAAAAAAGDQVARNPLGSLPARPVLVTLPIAIIATNDVPRFLLFLLFFTSLHSIIQIFLITIGGATIEAS